MKMVPLGELMPARNHSLNPAKHADEEFELHSIPAFDRGQPDLVLGGEIGSSKQVVQPGDVLISKIVPHIRRATVIPQKTGRRQLASSEWIVFRGELFDPKYLVYFLTSNNFHKQFMNTVSGVGGSLLRARPQYVRSIMAPFPHIDEQRHIATILDKADTLRQKHRQAASHIEELIQAVFLNSFAGHEAWKPIGELAESTQYGSSAKAGSSGTWPILRMGNITYGGSLDLTDLKYLDLKEGDIPKYTVRRGDLLFNRTNSVDLVGKTCVVDTDDLLAFAGYLIRVRFPRPETALVISGYLNSPRGKAVLRNMAKAIVGQANINANELRSIQVPSATLEQEALYSAQVTKIKKMADRLAAKTAEADRLFASLQSRAFRGEL